MEIDPVKFGQLIQSIEEQTKTIDGFTAAHKELTGKVVEFDKKLVAVKGDVESANKSIGNIEGSMSKMNERLDKGSRIMGDQKWALRIGFALIIILFFIIIPTLGPDLLKLVGMVH